MHMFDIPEEKVYGGHSIVRTQVPIEQDLHLPKNIIILKIFVIHFLGDGAM